MKAILLIAVIGGILGGLPAYGAGKKPNIVVIWGDDTGLTNVSSYGQGVVGYKTPNIDRIADEGVLFTDYLVLKQNASSENREEPQV